MAALPLAIANSRGPVSNPLHRQVGVSHLRSLPPRAGEQSVGSKALRAAAWTPVETTRVKEERIMSVIPPLFQPKSTELGTCRKLVFSVLYKSPKVPAWVCARGLWFLLNHGWKKHQHNSSYIQDSQQQGLFLGAKMHAKVEHDILHTSWSWDTRQSSIQNTQGLVRQKANQCTSCNLRARVVLLGEERLGRWADKLI